MSMKKTDLEKNMAKKLDGRLKSQAIPQRFAQGSGKVAGKQAEATTPAKAKHVQVSCRLPAPLAAQLRERAIGHEGGLSALVTVAVEQFLGKNTKP